MVEMLEFNSKHMSAHLSVDYFMSIQSMVAIMDVLVWKACVEGKECVEPLVPCVEGKCGSHC
jgi:hypothetical protein